MSYVLILSIITAYGGVTTQRQGEYQSFQECPADAVGRIESMRPLYPDADVKWQCEAH